MRLKLCKITKAVPLDVNNYFTINSRLFSRLKPFGTKLQSFFSTIQN